MTSQPNRKKVREFRDYRGSFTLDGSWSYTVCPPAQAEYIRVRNGLVSYTRELRNGLIIDIDKDGYILGVEIIGLPKKNKS